MPRKLGVYWSVMHRRPEDYGYFKRLNPSVVKIMDGGTPDYSWVSSNLPETLVIARDWALSEQHDDMFRDPEGTARSHVMSWDNHQKRLGFDRSKTLVLGINEPRVWVVNAPEALRRYTVALCNMATPLGLRIGAMQLSVGWPANNGPDTPPDWSPFHGVEDAIRFNNGALVLHEYWADNGPSENWGWWAGRSLKCPWQVPLVIGECGIDLFVKNASVSHSNRGWRGHVSAERYATELSDYTERMSADPRFVGCCVFASDYANGEWASFDVLPAYEEILKQSEEAKVFIPVVKSPLELNLTHPVLDPQFRKITQGWMERPEYYKQFNLSGHNGIDYATPVGSEIVAVDRGRVVEVASDPKGYGLYVKLSHDWGESLYAHLSKQLVTPGSHIQKGNLVGYSGNTGNSSGPHLHFGIRVHPYNRNDGKGGFSNPLHYLQRLNVLEKPSKPSSATLVQLIKDSAREFKLEWELLASLAWAESSFDVFANSGFAKGLLQISDITWQEWSVKVGAKDIYAPLDNIRTGAAYLSFLYEYYQKDIVRALWAYNAGPGNVNLNQIPPQTREFANKVLHGRDLLKAIGV